MDSDLSLVNTHVLTGCKAQKYDCMRILRTFDQWHNQSAVVLQHASTQHNAMEHPIIETFPNPEPNRRYVITHINPEFTSVCPKTGLPDFGTVTVRYIPRQHCIELKSLKYYYLSYRNQGIYYEAVTNKILDDLVAACDPEEMTVITEWRTRGGMHSIIEATYTRTSEQ